MEVDISKALSYEIKKELADRYFGFRSLIEREKEVLSAKVREYSLTLEQEIGHDLVRIYMMLRNERLIDRFFEFLLAELLDKLSDIFKAVRHHPPPNHRQRVALLPTESHTSL